MEVRIVNSLIFIAEEWDWCRRKILKIQLIWNGENLPGSFQTFNKYHLK